MVAQTRHGGQPTKKRLAFHEKLAGKGVTTDALLKKLKTLHQQLALLEQENVEVNSLSTVLTELVHTSLLLHKDRGVKAYTACCLADILRLYAPKAPYTQHELRDIFQFFFRQLSAGFKGQDEPYYTEYFHLLESLSTVKSVVLVCDLPAADELLHEIFRDVFTIVKRDFTRKVELYMADILVALIDECNSLPSDVLEVLMAQFIDKNAVSRLILFLSQCARFSLSGPRPSISRLLLDHAFLSPGLNFRETTNQPTGLRFKSVMGQQTDFNDTFASTLATSSLLLHQTTMKKQIATPSELHMTLSSGFSAPALESCIT